MTHVSEHVCTQEKNIKRILAVMDGNGKEGLISQTAVLNNKVDSIKRSLDGLKIAVDGLLLIQERVELLREQLEKQRQKEYADMIRRQTNFRWFVGVAVTVVIAILTFYYKS